MRKSRSIIYFETEGREHLPQVLRSVKRAFKRRPELRELKLVIMTGTGEGPALAYAQLHEYSPRIIAVTFPPDFKVVRGESAYFPQISERLRKFFDGVGIKILTSRLPFDPISGAIAHNSEMQVIKDVLSIFGGGFSLAVQAVLSACDHGEVRPGETVLCITGDVAAIVSASTTERFLSTTEGFSVREILCKPRSLTITRKPVKASGSDLQKDLFEDKADRKVIDVPSVPTMRPSILKKL